jgi:hypothetical protein
MPAWEQRVFRFGISPLPVLSHAIASRVGTLRIGRIWLAGEQLKYDTLIFVAAKQPVASVRTRRISC